MIFKTSSVVIVAVVAVPSSFVIVYCRSFVVRSSLVRHSFAAFICRSFVVCSCVRLFIVPSQVYWYICIPTTISRLSLLLFFIFIPSSCRHPSSQVKWIVIFLFLQAPIVFIPVFVVVHRPTSYSSWLLYFYSVATLVCSPWCMPSSSLAEQPPQLLTQH